MHAARSEAKKPPIVQYLDEKVREYTRVENCLVIYPKNAHFEELRIYSEPLQVPLSAEYKWRIVAKGSLDLTEESARTPEETYPILERFGCRITMKGALFRKPIFGTVNEDRDRDLALFVERDPVLDRLLRKLKPDVVYMNPTYEEKIIWLVTLIKGPINDTMLTRSKINNTYETMNRLCELAKEFTQGMLSHLHNEEWRSKES